tara:strand:- start:404 stop:739 length:336 start_codon:yes stop_codon:yes gene_type:complete
MKQKLIAFIPVFFVLVNCSDIQKNTYKDKKEIIKDKAIQRGWIPEIIPDSASQIREEHNLDLNTVKGIFVYNEKDEVNFIDNLEKSNNEYIWNNFVFKIDKENNKVEFQNY